MGRKVKGKGKKTAKIGRKIPDRFKFLQSQNKLSDNDTRQIMSRIRAINSGSATVESVDKDMQSINKLMRGFGVEAITEGSLNLLYVNMGDTYDTTIVYDMDEGRARVGDWGTYVEAVL